MQSKAVRLVKDEDRYCASCGYEGSPNLGPSDDLRFYDGGALYHPSCFEELDWIIDMMNKSSTSPQVATETLKQMGINPDLVRIDG